MSLPVQNLTHVFTPVLHPVLSEFHDNKKKIYKSYYIIVKILATVGFPLSIFLYFSAYEIISIMYGAQWLESIPVFKFLALSVGIQIVLSSTGSIFQATNRTDLLFYSGFLSAILILSGIGYGVFYGKTLVSVGLFILLAFSINFFQGFYLLINLALNQSFIKFLQVFIYPTITSIFIALALWSIEKFSISNVFLSLTVKVIVAFTLFIIIFMISKENRIFYKNYLRKRK